MSAFIYKSLSVLFFVLMSVCIKATGDNLPLFEVVFFRNLFALIPLIVVIVGVLITEEGGGVPPLIRQLTQDSRNIWNAGVIAMGLVIALKYVYGN